MTAPVTRVEWVIRCREDAPTVIASGPYASEDAANAALPEFNTDFPHCGPHWVEPRTITERVLAPEGAV